MKPFIKVYFQKCASFIEFVIFGIGFFTVRDKKSRAYIYLTLFNIRLCLGVQWKSEN